MRAFLSFGFAGLVALVLTAPLVPYLWKKEKASAILLLCMSVLVIAMSAFSWIEFTGVGDW